MRKKQLKWLPTKLLHSTRLLRKFIKWSKTTRNANLSSRYESLLNKSLVLLLCELNHDLWYCCVLFVYVLQENLLSDAGDEEAVSLTSSDEAAVRDVEITLTAQPEDTVDESKSDVVVVRQFLPLENPI